VRLVYELKRKDGRGLDTADAPDDEVALLTLADFVRDGERTVEAELHLDYVPAKVGVSGKPFTAAWRYRLEKAAVAGK
jgi:hypothetical protein